MPRRPKLRRGMSVATFRSYYWMKADLVAFARELGVATNGYKPELTARIERRLRGLPGAGRPERPRPRERDSDAPIRRGTPVVNYWSDAKTRAFFISQIGRGFHFTYRLNQYRIAHDNLTYGDLVDEWLAEHRRRQDDDYHAPLAEHGKYNRYVRDFFADPLNRGKTMRDAASAWNAVKFRRGDPRYVSSTSPGRAATKRTKT